MIDPACFYEMRYVCTTERAEEGKKREIYENKNHAQLNSTQLSLAFPNNLLCLLASLLPRLLFTNGMYVCTFGGSRKCVRIG